MILQPMRNFINDNLIKLGIALIFFIACCGVAISVPLSKTLLVYGRQPPTKITSSSLSIQILWQIEVDEAVNQAPVIANNQVIVSTSKAIYGLDIPTGQQFWRHIPVEQPSLAPITVTNKVIYGNRVGQITALNTTTGEIVWQRNINKTLKINSIVLGNKFVYVATTPTTLIEAIDLQSGKLVWRVEGSEYNIPSRGAKLFFWEDEVYVFTTKMHILDAKTGQLKQSLLQDFKPAQLVNDRFYTSRSVREVETFEMVGELRSPSYKLLWDNCESFRTPYTFSETMYYAAGRCGGVYALDIESNQIKWKYRAAASAESPMALYRNKLYVLFDDGEIHAIDPQTGQGQGILKTNRDISGVVRNASFLSRGLVANEDILVATFNDKNVWAFCEPPCFEP